MRLPSCLDLFCGAGGAGMGYRLAGFEVVGVDKKVQKDYPSEFILGDAIDFLKKHGREFDFIHASPPCQRWTMGAKRWGKRVMNSHPDLITPTRKVLRRIGQPYVIENIPQAPLLDSVTVCGSAFHMSIRRHRNFESNVPIEGSGCFHERQSDPIWPSNGGRNIGKGRVISIAGHGGWSAGIGVWSHGIGMFWGTLHGKKEAIPPDYAAFIGRQVWRHLYISGVLGGRDK